MGAAAEGMAGATGTAARPGRGGGGGGGGDGEGGGGISGGGANIPVPVRDQLKLWAVSRSREQTTLPSRAPRRAFCLESTAKQAHDQVYAAVHGSRCGERQMQISVGCTVRSFRRRMRRNDGPACCWQAHKPDHRQVSQHARQLHHDDALCATALRAPAHCMALEHVTRAKKCRKSTSSTCKVVTKACLRVPAEGSFAGTVIARPTQQGSPRLTTVRVRASSL